MAAKKKASGKKIIAYKGFNNDFACREHQFEIGKSYKVKGPIKACSNGFQRLRIPAGGFRLLRSGYQPVRSRGAATASGTRGAATASGTRGAATASGFNGKAKASEGSALFLVERHDDWRSPDHGKILHAWAGIAGQNGVKPDVFYTLVNGEPVEAE